MGDANDQIADPVLAGSEGNANRRASERRRVLKGIKISFGNEFCAVEGVVRNLSETGAMIEIRDGFIVPDKITIHNELDGYKINCEIVRRKGNVIGVQFTGPRQPIETTRAQIINMDDGRHVEETEEIEVLAVENDPEPISEDEKFESRYSIRKKPVFGKLS